MPAAGVDLSATVERRSLGVEHDEIFLCQAEPAHLGGGVVGGGPGEDGGGGGGVVGGGEVVARMSQEMECGMSLSCSFL